MVRPATSTSLPLNDRKSTRLNSSHSQIAYAAFCLKKKSCQGFVAMPVTESELLQVLERVLRLEWVHDNRPLLLPAPRAEQAEAKAEEAPSAAPFPPDLLFFLTQPAPSGLSTAPRQRLLQT